MIHAPFNTGTCYHRNATNRHQKRLINQAFLMAIDLITSGAFFSLRLGHGAALICHPAYHSLPRRHFATPRAPLLLYFLSLQHSF